MSKEYEFDIFLAHHNGDKPLVREISRQLKQRGLKPWIDEEQIAPGRSFQQAIQQAIPTVKTAAIIFGPDGVGLWQEWEIQALFSQCVSKNTIVIPVLLPGVDTVPEILPILQQLRWINFTSANDTTALELLIWGITGRKPTEKLEDNSIFRDNSAQNSEVSTQIIQPSSNEADTYFNQALLHPDPMKQLIWGITGKKPEVKSQETQTRLKTGQSQVKVNEVKLSIEHADVREFRADVLALKYAMYLYGADNAVALALGKTNDDVSSLVPTIGDSDLLDSQEAIASKQVLFTNVGDLYRFGYDEIRSFASDTLKALAKLIPTVEHVAMTIHGVGNGLDEVAALKVQIAGYMDAIEHGSYPDRLKRISIVERHPQRARLLELVLDDFLPGKAIYQNSTDRDVLVRKIRHLDRNVAEKAHVFVAISSSEEMTDVFYYGIQGPIHQAGFLCERIDVKSFTNDILQRVKSRIESSTCVVAEITHSNPNVFLEIGYAWGCGRPTILIAKDTEQVPFDVGGQRCLVYKTIRDLDRILSSELKSLIQQLS